MGLVSFSLGFTTPGGASDLARQGPGGEGFRQFRVTAAPWLPLALILLLALALRLIRLDERNLWYDEAFAILFAGKGLAAMLYGTLTPVAGGAADIHPLLYYVVLDGWMALFGETAFAARFLSVLLGVATVAAIYGLTRDLFDRRVGLAAALVTALAPFHVQYSQEARMYSLLALLLVLATWSYVRASRLEGPGWRGALVFGGLAALAMYTQQLAALYLLALALLPVLQRDRRMLRWVALGGIVALLLYLPWLLQLPAQWSKVGAYYWVPVPNAARFLLTLRVFFAGGTEPPTPTALLMLGGALGVVALLGVQLILVGRRLRPGARRSLLLVLWLAVAPPLLMWLVSQAQPVYLERALLPSAVMLYVALGWLLAAGGMPRLLAVAAGLVALVVAVAGLSSHYTWDTFPNSPYRQAAAQVAAEWQPGDVVVHQSKLSALPMVVYASALDQRFIRDLPGSPEDTLAEPTREVIGAPTLDCVQAVGPVARRVWYITFSRLREQSLAAGRADVAAGVAWLDTHYTAAQTWTWNDLEMTLYTSPTTEAQAGVCA